MNALLQVKDLKTTFKTLRGEITAVDGVNFQVNKGEILGIVGESGCGKSVTSQSIMRLYNEKDLVKYQGEIILEDTDLLKLSEKEMQKVRGNDVAMIFQDALSSLNPVFTVGSQISEAIHLHQKISKKEARERAIELLRLTGIPIPEKRVDAYPHEMSGGMRQRVMIAMALACQPQILIADEPTTALDVTIQAQILDLMRNLKDKINSSIMLITHDLGVIAEMADYVVVMYAGRVVEKGTVQEIFKNPLHPYTIGLQKSKPVVGKEVDRLYSIPGNVPNPINMLQTCYFKDRCNMKCDACKGEYPPMIQVSPTHFVSCYRCMDKGEIV